MSDTFSGASTRGAASKEHFGPLDSLDDCRQALSALQEKGEAFSVIYASLQNLDTVLEGLDKATAEEVVTVLVSRLTRCVRGGDSAFQAGAGDYLILIRGTYAAGAYQSLRERIRNAVEAEVSLGGKQLFATVSFGYASFPEDGHTPDELISHARSSMERAVHSSVRAQKLNQQIDAMQTEDPRADAPFTNGNRRFNVDELTGLPDAQYFRAKASEIVSDTNRFKQGLSIVFCDIEEFKTYNLRYGYVAGDDLLQFLADCLSDAFPEGPVTRLNSDRFCVLANTADATEKIEQVHDAVRSFRANSNAELKAGIYDMIDSEVSVSQAQDYARLACDSIKGRFDYNWRRFDEGLSNEVNRRQYIIDNLDTAINAGWIEMYYQPIVRSFSGHICGFEALARWNDPELGMLPPGEFIDVLEDARLIHKLDIQVVRQVCKDGMAALQAYDFDMGVSINLSRLDYQLCDIFAAVNEIVEVSDFPRRLLHIEFTESAFIHETELFNEVLGKFRDAGYQVWMDDFGSGYSSLNLLKDYDFDVLKIDMEFLRTLAESPRTRDIVVSVIDMAKKLGIQTLAEGVETEEQADFLKSIGCEMLQGYLFSRPLPIVELQESVFEQLGLERATEHVYFDTLGKVNMLSPSPFVTNDDSVVMELASVAPLAIIEREGAEIRTIASTDAFDDVVEEAGLLADTETEAFSDKGALVVNEVLRLGDAVDGDDSVKYISFYDFKDLYTLRMQHLASCADRHAFLAVLDKYDTTKNNMAAFTGAGSPATGEGPEGGKMIYLPQAQETPWQTGDDIDISHTALVVIDVLGGSEGVTPGLEKAATNCVLLAKAAREIGVPVVFSIDNHIAGLDRELELWGDHGVRGTQSGAPLDDFDITDADFVIPKRRYNGFFQTDLDLTLRELGVDTIIMVGYDTNICVLQTLAGAYFNGYKTIVPADATATFLVGNQEYALEYFTRCYDTRVVDTAKVLEYFAR